MRSRAMANAGLERVHGPEPELRPFALQGPEPRDLARALGQDARAAMGTALAIGLGPLAPRWLAAHEALVADPRPDRVEDERAAGVERAPLPLGDLLEDRIGEGRDELGRDVDAAELLEGVADRPRAHPPRARRGDLVVEVGDAPQVAGAAGRWR